MFLFRSKNGRTPAKYGRYQRNICTFTESFVYYSVGQVVLLVSVLLLGSAANNPSVSQSVFTITEKDVYLPWGQHPFSIES